jgi:hypothetical protein
MTPFLSSYIYPAPQVRVLLVAGLALVPDDERGGQEPGDVAAEVETAIFQKFGSTGAEYGAKVRLLEGHTAVRPAAVWLSSVPCPLCCSWGRSRAPHYAVGIHTSCGAPTSIQT